MEWMFVRLLYTIVDSYDFIPDYIDFDEKRPKIRRKSVYHRKCHTENINLNQIIEKHGTEISYKKRQKIYDTFKLFD